MPKLGELIPTPEEYAPSATEGPRLLTAEDMHRMLLDERADTDIPREMYDVVLPIALTRAREVEAAPPSIEALTPGGDELGPGSLIARTPFVGETEPVDELSDPRLTLTRLDEYDKMKAFDKKFATTMNAYYDLRALQKAHPDIADEIGMTPDYWDRVLDGMKSVGKVGWNAVDFLIRNIDRGGSALRSYIHTKVVGGSDDDAFKRAMSHLKGSDRGFKMRPEELGPSGKEILMAAGFDDNWGTATMGFALEVLLDPLMLFGFGLAGRAIRIGNHQLLNKAGRAIYGNKLLENARKAGYANWKEVPIKAGAGKAAVWDITQQTQRDMREMLRAGGPDLARQLLDFGGLKLSWLGFGDYTLIPSRRLAKMKRLTPEGEFEDFVARPLAGITGEEIMSKLTSLGTWAEKSRLPLPQALREFTRNIPDHIRQLGTSVGHLLSRTNPFAGAEYRALKESQYYERLAYDRGQILNLMSDVFRGVSRTDKERMSRAIEAGTVEALEPNLQQVVNRYRDILDDQIVEEVKRGVGVTIPEWPEAKRNRFIEWVRARRHGPARADAALDPKELTSFQSAYRTNYVPHIYRNTWKANSIRKRRGDMRPMPPTVIQRFAFRRIVDTFDEAHELGLVPELDLEKLAVIRLETGSRATATVDFIGDAYREFGLSMSGRETKEMSKILAVAGEPLPSYSWQQLLNHPITDQGRIVGDAEEHMRWAMRIVHEARVPAHALKVLDDSAKRAFLTQKLRLGTVAENKRYWKRYVEDAADKGLYERGAITAYDTLGNAAAAAKEMMDPLYGDYQYLNVFGHRDKWMNRLLMPTPIKEDLERLSMEVMPQELKNLVRVLDKVQHTWKRNVTQIWPAFHLRNKLTNVVNSMADIGLRVITDRPTLWKIMWGKKGELKTSIPDINYTFDQVREMLHRFGVVRPLYRRTDIGEAFEKVVVQRTEAGARRGLLGPIPMPGGKARATQEALPNPLAHPYQFGEAVAMNVENGDRALLFISSLKRGMTPDQAAARVNRFLFDYEDIGKFERDWVRRVVPFWTWTRKNLVLQSRIAGTAPQHIANIGKFLRNYSREGDSDIRASVERELLPAYWNDTLGLRISTGKRISKWLTRLDLPINELNKFYNRSVSDTLVKEWLLNISPYITETAEIALGYDFYTGRKTAELTGQRVASLVGAAPERIRRWLGYKREYKRDQTRHYVDAGKWKVVIVASLLSGIGLRPYYTAASIFDPEVSPSWRLLNVLSGAKVRISRPEEEARRRSEAVLFGDKEITSDLLRKRDAFLTSLVRRGVTPNSAPIFPEDIAIEQAVLTPEHEDALEVLQEGSE